MSTPISVCSGVSTTKRARKRERKIRFQLETREKGCGSHDKAETSRIYFLCSLYFWLRREVVVMVYFRNRKAACQNLSFLTYILLFHNYVYLKKYVKVVNGLKQKTKLPFFLSNDDHGIDNLYSSILQSQKIRRQQFQRDLDELNHDVFPDLFLNTGYGSKKKAPICQINRKVFLKQVNASISRKSKNLKASTEMREKQLLVDQIRKKTEERKLRKKSSKGSQRILNRRKKMQKHKNNSSESSSKTPSYLSRSVSSENIKKSISTPTQVKNTSAKFSSPRKSSMLYLPPRSLGDFDIEFLYFLQSVSEGRLYGPLIRSVFENCGREFVKTCAYLELLVPGSLGGLLQSNFRLPLGVVREEKIGKKVKVGMAQIPQRERFEWVFDEMVKMVELSFGAYVGGEYGKADMFRGLVKKFFGRLVTWIKGGEK